MIPNDYKTSIKIKRRYLTERDWLICGRDPRIILKRNSIIRNNLIAVRQAIYIARMKGR